MKAVGQEVLLIFLYSYTVKGQVDSSEGAPDDRQVQESEAKCAEAGMAPFFEPEMVVGKPWRVYYTWNLRLENKCIDIRFEIASEAIIRRIYYEMYEYLEEQPAWGAASLLMTMGKAKREMLLFDDQGPPGRVLGVPNTLRDGSINPVKQGVPLLKFQMKLMNKGKFLLIIDCMIGLASISVRHERPFSRLELHTAASNFSKLFGEGRHACLAERTKLDRMLMP